MNVTLVDSVMETWSPDTRHYITDDDVHLAVHVDAGVNEATAVLINEALEALEIPQLDSGVNKLVVEETTIIECNDEGIALTLTPMFRFDPGTTHEEALIAAGYSVT